MPASPHRPRIAVAFVPASVFACCRRASPNFKWRVRDIPRRSYAGSPSYRKLAVKSETPLLRTFVSDPCAAINANHACQLFAFINLRYDNVSYNAADGRNADDSADRTTSLLPSADQRQGIHVGMRTTAPIEPPGKAPPTLEASP